MANERHTDVREWEVDFSTRQSAHPYTKFYPFRQALSTTAATLVTAGQGEIDFVYDSLTTTADNVMMYKYVLKNVAREYGMLATFMPKPLFGDNGTGMHTHLSIWQGEENLFAGEGYAGLSETALYAIGGILKHAPALLAGRHAVQK